MNIIFFGNGDFGVHTLKSLHESEYNILALVTNLDKKKGRGLLYRKNNLYNEANKRKIKIIQENNIEQKSFVDKIKKFNADVFVVISYKIIPKEIFILPKFGTINLHASYLPKYRGSSPIQKALMNGDRAIGLTSFLIEEKIDNGKIIKQELYDVNEHSTYSEVHDLLSFKGGQFMLDTLSLLSLNRNKFAKQDMSKATYAKKIIKEDYQISFNCDSKYLHNKIRSLTMPGCYCYIGQKRLKFFDTFYCDKNLHNLDIGNYLYENESIIIGCKIGVLIVKSIQFEGKKIISAKDFNNMNIIFKSFNSNGQSNK